MGRHRKAAGATHTQRLFLDAMPDAPQPVGRKRIKSLGWEIAMGSLDAGSEPGRRRWPDQSQMLALQRVTDPFEAVLAEKHMLADESGRSAEHTTLDGLFRR